MEWRARWLYIESAASLPLKGVSEQIVHLRQWEWVVLSGWPHKSKELQGRNEWEINCLDRKMLDAKNKVNNYYN